MSEYLKANKEAIGERLFFLFRWAVFLLYLNFLRFILFAGPYSDRWFGLGFWKQVGAWAAIPVMLAVAQWVIYGRVNMKAFLPWKK